MDASKTEVLSSESRAIPSRRIVVNDPGQLPMDYSTTPGGTIFSTTPGGKFVRCFGCFNAELSKITLWRPITNWMPQVFNYSLRLWVCFELIDTSIFNCVVGNLWTCNCNASVLVCSIRMGNLVVLLPQMWRALRFFSFLIDTCLFCKSLNRVSFESVQ